jgi:hypothetical protein
VINENKYLKMETVKENITYYPAFLVWGRNRFCQVKLPWGALGIKHELWKNQNSGACAGFERHGKVDGGEKESETDGIIPGKSFLKDDPGEDDEDAQGDAFLNDLELVARELSAQVAMAIGGHHEAIFEEGDSPGHEDDCDERLSIEPLHLQVAIPSQGHEDI